MRLARRPSPRLLGCLAGVFWGILFLVAGLLALLFAGLAGPAALVLLGGWAIAAFCFVALLVVSPTRRVFLASTAAALVSSVLAVLAIPSSTYVEEPVTLLIISLAALGYSAIGWAATHDRP